MLTLGLERLHWKLQQKRLATGRRELTEEEQRGNCMPKLGRRYVKRTNGFAVNYRPPKEGDGPWEWDAPLPHYVAERGKKVWGSETILGAR